MTASQMMDLFSAQADMHWSASETAFSSRDYGLLAFNLSAALDSHLMVALLTWRDGQNNPSGSMNRVCEVAINGLDLMQQVEPDSQHWRSFDFLPAGYCALLLDRSLGLPLNDILSGCGADPGAHLPQCLDACIFAAVDKDSRPSQWDTFVSKLSGQRRLKLLFDTYDAYFRIIFEGNESESWQIDSVKTAATLYRARRNDEFFSGGRGTDGGGLDNRFVVDYRLAAIAMTSVQTASPDLADELGVHHWRW